MNPAPAPLSRARWDGHCLNARRKPTVGWDVLPLVSGLGPSPRPARWKRPKCPQAGRLPQCSPPCSALAQCHPLPTMQPAQWHLALETRGRVGAGVAREAFWSRSSVRGALLSLQAADLREGRRAKEVRKPPGLRQSSEDGRAELVLITKRTKTAAYLHQGLTTRANGPRIAGWERKYTNPAS